MSCTFPLCQTLHLSSHAQIQVNPHLAEACTLLKNYIEVCGQSRILVQNENRYCRTHILSIHLCYLIHSCFSSKCSYSVTVLMSATVLVPPVPKRFECFPLEKIGHEPFLLGDSLILQSLRKWNMMRVYHFLFCGASFEVSKC